MASFDAAILDDAVNRAETDEVRALLDRGISPNARDISGDTPLMNAAWVGALGIVKLLIERGADVNARGRDGRTALSRLLEMADHDSEHERVIGLLIEAGAIE